MTSATKPGSSALFTYDGDGHRVKATVSGVTTTFVGNYYEWNGTAGSKYYYANGQRIAMRNAATTLSWLIGDHLGSTSKVANSSGTLTSTTLYKPWGEVRYQSGTLPTDYTYTGQYSHTDDFGLMYYNARWYDPVLGRMAQADTLVPGAGNPMAFDRYAYTLNNPLRYIDPTGHDTECGLGVICPEEKDERCFDEACNTFYMEDGKGICVRGSGCVTFAEIYADIDNFSLAAEEFLNEEIFNSFADLFNAIETGADIGEILGYIDEIPWSIGIFVNGGIQLIDDLDQKNMSNGEWLWRGAANGGISQIVDSAADLAGFVGGMAASYLVPLPGVYSAVNKVIEIPTNIGLSVVAEDVTENHVFPYIHSRYLNDAQGMPK